MQCARCDKFSLGDGPRVGCRTTGNTDSSCREGHNIWIRKCKDRSRDYQFNILKNPGSGDQVRVDGTNLCLSTVNNRYLELRNCDRSNSRQLWKPIDNINKFELRPYHQRNWRPSDAKCLSQLHHPKVSLFCSFALDDVPMTHAKIIVTPSGQGTCRFASMPHNSGSRDNVLGGIPPLEYWHNLLTDINYGGRGNSLFFWPVFFIWRGWWLWWRRTVFMISLETKRELYTLRYLASFSFIIL